MERPNDLLPKHGGYKRLLSYQLAELVVFDITVLFCRKYIPPQDRTHDQMVQSGRSGYQNIAEGSVDSGVSRKSEIKLTGIAVVGCQDELAKDYHKYLEHRGLAKWPSAHPALQKLRTRRVRSLSEFRCWVRDTWEESGRKLQPDEVAANGVLTLLNLTMFLTRKQLAALEKCFLKEGGITERMYRLRRKAREG